MPFCVLVFGQVGSPEYCAEGLAHTRVQGQCEEQPADLVELHPGKRRPGRGLVTLPVATWQLAVCEDVFHLLKRTHRASRIPDDDAEALQIGLHARAVQKVQQTFSQTRRCTFARSIFS